MKFEQVLLSIEARNAARTQGRWTLSAREGSGYSNIIRVKEPFGKEIAMVLSNRGTTGGSNCDPDAAFIAHAPDDVTLLLEVVGKLKEVVADCKHTLQWYKSSPEWVQGSIELCDETLADLDRLAGGGK